MPLAFGNDPGLPGQYKPWQGSTISLSFPSKGHFSGDHRRKANPSREPSTLPSVLGPTVNPSRQITQPLSASCKTDKRTCSVGFSGRLSEIINAKCRLQHSNLSAHFIRSPGDSKARVGLGTIDLVQSELNTGQLLVLRISSIKIKGETGQAYFKG